MTSITDHIILKESGEYDTEVVKRLKIERYGLLHISNLERCINLVELSLAFNEIRTISGLNMLDSLRRLDLSHNKIERIENLSELISLEWLNLRANNVESISEVEALVPATALASLYFQNLDGSEGNPVCAHPSYSAIIQRTLPQLQVLDGGHLLLVDASESMEAYINGIGASSEACRTPPIQPWFSASDLVVPGVEEDPLPTSTGAAGGAGDAAAPGCDSVVRPFHCTENTLEAFASLDDEMTRVNQMLDEDSSHLLRKATTMFGKISKAAGSGGGTGTAGASASASAGGEKKPAAAASSTGGTGPKSKKKG